MSELQRQWPDAKFIHIVRDGRHAAVSMKKHAGFVRLINAGFPDEEKHYAYNKQATSFSTTPVTVVNCICFWMRIATDIRQEAERVPQKAYLELRFEDLLLNPLWEIIRILRFLDAPIILHHLQWAVQFPAPFKISSQWSGFDSDLYSQLTAKAKEELQIFGHSTSRPRRNKVLQVMQRAKKGITTFLIRS